MQKKKKKKHHIETPTQNLHVHKQFVCLIFHFIPASLMLQRIKRNSELEMFTLISEIMVLWIASIGLLQTNVFSDHNI